MTNRETVIQLAKDTGLPTAWISETGVITWAQLERFAALVLEHGRKPLTDEQRDQEWAIMRDVLKALELDADLTEGVLAVAAKSLRQRLESKK